MSLPRYDMPATLTSPSQSTRLRGRPSALSPILSHASHAAYESYAVAAPGPALDPLRPVGAIMTPRSISPWDSPTGPFATTLRLSAFEVLKRCYE